MQLRRARFWRWHFAVSRKVALFGSFFPSLPSSALFFARERRALVGSPWAFPSRMCSRAMRSWRSSSARSARSWWSTRSARTRGAGTPCQSCLSNWMSRGDGRGGARGGGHERHEPLIGTRCPTCNAGIERNTVHDLNRLAARLAPARTRPSAVPHARLHEVRVAGRPLRSLLAPHGLALARDARGRDGR